MDHEGVVATWGTIVLKWDSTMMFCNLGYQLFDSVLVIWSLNLDVCIVRMAVSAKLAFVKGS